MNTILEDIRLLLVTIPGIIIDDVRFKTIPSDNEGKMVLNLTGGPGLSKLDTTQVINYQERMLQIIFIDSDVRKQDLKLEQVEKALLCSSGVTIGTTSFNKFTLFSGPLNLGLDKNNKQMQSLNFKITFSRLYN